jgi:hypothetical protein
LGSISSIISVMRGAASLTRFRTSDSSRTMAASPPPSPPVASSNASKTSVLAAW